MSYKTLVVDQSWSADLLGMVENPTQGKKNCKIYIICFLKSCSSYWTTGRLLNWLQTDCTSAPAATTLARIAVYVCIQNW